MKAVQPDFAMLSDYYSDNEQPNDIKKANQNSKYKEAVAMLQRRCEFYSQNNERLVRRLHYVKRMTVRKTRDVTLLKGRLDVYNDEWRLAQPDPITNVKMPTNLTPTGKVRKPRMRKNNAQPASTQASVPNAKPRIEEKIRKRKRMKTEKEKDPNAPKRPANPFFKFCQEQRSILMDELNGELQPGQPELSKQELTRQLAQRWRSMDPATKQIYVDKYESSKQKYNLEMLSYKKDAVPANSSKV